MAILEPKNPTLKTAISFAPVQILWDCLPLILLLKPQRQIRDTDYRQIRNARSKVSWGLVHKKIFCLIWRALHKICKNTGFPVFSRIKTILSLFGRIWVSENPYSRIFYAVEQSSSQNAYLTKGDKILLLCLHELGKDREQQLFSVIL